MYDDMPGTVDPDSGPFIPPPLEAAYGGQPYNPFPGASPSSGHGHGPGAGAGHGQGQGHPWGPAPPAPWSANAAPTPPWFNNHPHQAPQYPASARPWHGTPYPSHNTPWSAPTPAGSYGDATPALSWGPETPPNAHAHGYPSPYVHPQAMGDSSSGQPITASPWFNGGGNMLPGSGGGGGGGGGIVGGAGLVMGQGWATPGDNYGSPSRRQRHGTHHNHNHKSPKSMGGHSPSAFGLHRTLSHEVPKIEFAPRPGLKRTLSSGGGGGGVGGPRSRKNSGNLQPFSLYQQMQSEEYNMQNLARRPRDWRSDYEPRAGLVSYIPRVPRPRSDVVEWSDPVKRTAHEFLAYERQNPPIYLDLRFNPPDTLEFTHMGRPFNRLDLVQLATAPPAQSMRLFHPSLPWYIDIVQHHENGITVQDVIWQMFMQLDVPIQARHWYNEELDVGLHEKMNRQYQMRTVGNPDEAARGVKRVEFLRGKVVFEGLVRTRNGLWEIKTRKWEDLE